MGEQTLVFFKPDAVKRGLVGRILGRFEDKGLTLKQMRLLTLTSEQADYHYHEHVEKGFYPNLKEYVTSGPIVAMVLEGREVISVVRTMLGATDSVKAAPGTIRGDFGLLMTENLVHASDSPESAAREIAHFFG